eukprot:3703970-Amphidinium_carterae.1
MLTHSVHSAGYGQCYVVQCNIVPQQPGIPSQVSRPTTVQDANATRKCITFHWRSNGPASTFYTKMKADEPDILKLDQLPAAQKGQVSFAIPEL